MRSQKFSAIEGVDVAVDGHGRELFAQDDLLGGVPFDEGESSESSAVEGQIEPTNAGEDGEQSCIHFISLPLRILAGRLGVRK